MAKATLSVTVNGGKAPGDIQVSIFREKVLLDSFSKEKSFTKTFQNLTAGNYILFVHGFNPAGGNTDLGLSGTDITITRPPVNPLNKTGVAYLVEFRFTV